MATDPHRADAVSDHLRNDVTAWARQQPGFVRRNWLISTNRDVGMGIVVFESAATVAQAAIGPHRHVHDEDRAWNITAVTIYESVASATR